MGPSSPSPPTAQQPPMGETGPAEEAPGHRRKRALGPFAAGQVSGHQHPRIVVERPEGLGGGVLSTALTLPLSRLLGGRGRV